MTLDYKENILKYLTGNLPNQTGYNIVQYDMMEETQNNLYTQLKTYFSSMVQYRGFISAKDNKNNSLNYSVLACTGTLIGESDMTGAFVILDKNYNIVQVITEYSNGSKIGVIQTISVDDKGSFYAIELKNNTYRIVELNNLVLKLKSQSGYHATVTKAYNIPNAYNWDAFLKITRSEGKNKYFLLGETDTPNLVGCELDISDTQTWTYYTTTYSWNATAMATFNKGFYAYWDTEDELHFNIAVEDNGLVLLSKGNSTTMVATNILPMSISNPLNNFIQYSNKIGYYASIQDLTTKTRYQIYRVDIENKETYLIYQNEVDKAFVSRNQLWFFKSNNTINFYEITNQGGDTYSLTLGLISDYAITTVPLGTFEADTIFKTYCYANILSQFNKNYYFIQNQDTLFSGEFNWNPNNFNGPAFTSYGSLVPNKFSIEDENELEQLNRNLYNLSTYANRYTATGQIPNQMMNNTPIYNALLYSYNNNIISSKNINITKNVYEELNINFTNQINIIDNDTGTTNIDGAARLISSMLSRDIDAYIGKFRINYKDDTNEIKMISTNELTYTNNSTTYNIVVYTKKLINNIELLSNDETTTYKTIDCSNMTLNKYYQIIQKVKIE